MTNINYTRHECGFTIKADGHAGYANSGQDIVCAAVSVLLQTLAYRVMDLTLDYTFDISNGHFYLSTTGCKQTNESFNTILTGLELLESEYPNHVKVSSVGCPINQLND